MGQVIPLEDPLNYRAALQRIKRLWNEGYVEILPHAQKRMRQRHLDTNDIQYIIRYGRIVEHSQPKDLWRYTIEGTSVDGKEAACVVEIDDNLIIVTVVVKRRG